MENWGLLQFDERRVLFNEVSSTALHWGREAGWGAGGRGGRWRCLEKGGGTSCMCKHIRLALLPSTRDKRQGGEGGGVGVQVGGPRTGGGDEA